eukprot:9020-Heterococcus_DN1.PRE.3
MLSEALHVAAHAHRPLCYCEICRTDMRCCWTLCCGTQVQQEHTDTVNTALLLGVNYRQDQDAAVQPLQINSLLRQECKASL